MIPRDFDGGAEVLRALAHAVRLQILCSVKETERSVGEIEEVTGITQPGLSQQLGVLRKAGLVETRREGKQIFYRVDRARIAAVSELLNTLAGPAAERPVAPRSRPSSGAAVFARVTR